MSERRPQRKPDATYREIEAALASHAAGRLFLDEHARRSRARDTGALLEAVARLEAQAGVASAVKVIDHGLADIAAAAAAIHTGLAEAVPAGAGTEPRPEDGARSPKPLRDATDTAEDLQETAWVLRESGFEPALCNRFDQYAVEVDALATAHMDLVRRLTDLTRSLALLEDGVAQIRSVMIQTSAHALPTPEATA